MEMETCSVGYEDEESDQSDRIAARKSRRIPDHESARRVSLESDEGDDKTCFAEVLHKMLSQVSQKYPTVMGWSDDGKRFFFNTRDKHEMSKLIKPYFAHGNFASLRRQLSAYKFLRMPKGR